MKTEMLRKWLLSISDSDLSDDVRRRALQLLRVGEIKLPKKLCPLLPLGDRNEGVRSEAYEYLGAVGDDDALRQLEDTRFSDDPVTASAAQSAAASISLRLRPVETVAAMIASGEYISDKRILELEPFLTKVDEETLRKAAESQWVSIRKFSAAELVRRRSMSSELAQKLTKDSSIAIREIAFTELATQGKPLNFEEVRKSLSSESASENSWAASLILGRGTQASGDVDAVLRAHFRRNNPEFASGALDWFSLESVSAYKSLVTDHYDSARDDLHSDLENNFERIKQRSIDKIRERFGAEAATSAVEQFKHLDDFLRSRYAEAGLSAIAIYGDSSDVKFGRKYLDSGYNSVKLEAVRVVCRFGSAEDSGVLLQISKDGYGQVRDDAGIGALRLSPTPFKTAVELTQSKSDRVVQAAFDWLYTQESDEARNFFKGLLSDESDTNRVRSVYYFSKKLRRKGLTAVLDSQFDSAKYYYNVVTWLDRLLYSPRALRTFFEKELEREANSKR